MTRTTIALVDVAYWPVVQLSLSYVFVRLPARLFRQDKWIANSRRAEDSLVLYHRLHVPRWKRWLPDGAPMVGGARKQVTPFHREDMLRFLIDLRRSEIAHWAQIAFLAPCYFWNPVWAFLVMSAYAITINIPCILAQRYNQLLIRLRVGSQERTVYPPE